VPEASLRTGSVQSGQADVVYNISPQELGGLKDAGLTVAAPRYLGFVNGFALNTSIAPFNDKNVRLALQHGIDRDEILDTVYTEDWEPAQSFIQSNVAESTDHSDAFEYDPELAQELLDEAGWKPGADGVRERDGERLEFTVIFWQASDPLVAVQEQLKKIGVDLQITQVSVSESTARADQSDLQYSNVSRNEPDRLRQDFIQYLPAWIEADLDEAEAPDLAEIQAELDEQVGEQDPEARQELLANVQTQIIDDGYRFPLYTLISSIAVSDKVHDLKLDGTSRLTFIDTWIEQ
jgi:peptide/nickel transport system substrate-binding protein